MSTIIYKEEEKQTEAKFAEVRRRLGENYLSQTWLIAQLRTVGIITDKTILSSALRGTRKGPAVDRILEESEKILEKYESFYK